MGECEVVPPPPSPTHPQVLVEAESTVERVLKPLGINVKFGCSGYEAGTCYGSVGHTNNCAECVRAASANFVSISSGVHLLKHWQSRGAIPARSVRRTLAVIASLFQETPAQLVWSTGPSCEPLPSSRHSRGGPPRPVLRDPPPFCCCC